MRSFTLFPTVVLAIMLLLGCSSSGPSPILPDPGQPDGLNLTSQAERAADYSGNTVLWGYWEIQLNPLDGTAEVVPLRGVQWTVDVVRFMQPPVSPAGTLGIEVLDTSEWLSDGHLPVNVTLTHPFPGLAQYTGADVRGILIGPAQNDLEQDPDLSYSDGGTFDPWLANPDGLTRWMNPVEFMTDGTILTFTPGILGSGSGFNATLNPYKQFISSIAEDEDVYGFFSDPDNLADRGQFVHSSSVKRFYDLYFPLTGSGGDPDLVYQYAVIASWMEPIDLDPGDLPGSFPPDANCEESFLIKVTDNSTLYYDTSQAGGDLVLDVEIFDWQPYLKGEGSVIDEVGRVIVESPQGILPEPFVAIEYADLLPTAQAGTTDASSIVTIEITGCTPTGLEGQEIFIAIEHSGGIGYDNAGIGTNYPDAPLASYFMHTLNVSSYIPTGPIVESIDPDHGIPDTHIYDVFVYGQNFDDVTELKLVGESEEATAVNLDVIDSETMMCELDFDGLSIGFYDVVAVDPMNDDGVLEDGFEVMDCPGGIHDSFALYTATPSFRPLFVAGVFTSGPYAGQIITQKGAPAWNRIDVEDPPQDGTTVEFFANKPSLSNMYYDWSWSLDCDPLHEIFAFTTFDDDDDSGSWPNTQFDFVKICNQDNGTYVGACDTDCGYAVAQVDVDERGNVWAVCSNAYYPNFGFTLQRWDYDPDVPAPNYTFVNEWDISGIISGTRVISDIVVLQRYRRLYISTSSSSSTWGVEIHSWDFSPDPPSAPIYLGDAFTTQTGFYGTNSFQEVHQRFVDMEVDRTDDVLAGCRILVMYMGKPASYRTLELRKFDVDLNLIAQASHEFNYEYVYPPTGSTFQMWFSNFVVDDENGGRVVAIYDNFGVPGDGHIGVAEVPADW